MVVSAPADSACVANGPEGLGVGKFPLVSIGQNRGKNTLSPANSPVALLPGLLECQNAPPGRCTAGKRNECLSNRKLGQILQNPLRYFTIR